MSGADNWVPVEPVVESPRGKAVKPDEWTPVEPVAEEWTPVQAVEDPEATLGDKAAALYASASGGVADAFMRTAQGLTTLAKKAAPYLVEAGSMPAAPVYGAPPQLTAGQKVAATETIRDAAEWERSAIGAARAGLADVRRAAKEISPVGAKVAGFAGDLAGIVPQAVVPGGIALVGANGSQTVLDMLPEDIAREAPAPALLGGFAAGTLDRLIPGSILASTTAKAVVRESAKQAAINVAQGVTMRGTAVASGANEGIPEGEAPRVEVFSPSDMAVDVAGGGVVPVVAGAAHKALGAAEAKRLRAAGESVDAATVGEFATRHGNDLTVRDWSGPEASVGDLAARVAAEANTRLPQKVTLREPAPEVPSKAPDLAPEAPFTSQPGEPLAPSVKPAEADAPLSFDAPPVPEADTPVPHDTLVAYADDAAHTAAVRDAQVTDSDAGHAEASALKLLDKPHLSVDEWRSTLTKRELADDGSVAWDKIRDARKLEHAQRIPELEAVANAEVERRWRDEEWQSARAGSGFTLADLLNDGDVSLPAGVDAARLEKAHRSGKLGDELHALHKNLGNQGRWMNWVNARKSPSLDHTLEQLHEHGFRQIQDIPELLDALDKTVRGKPVYPAERPRSWALAAKRAEAPGELSVEQARPYSPPERLTPEQVKQYGDKRTPGERLRARVDDMNDNLVGFVRSLFSSRGAAPESVFNLKEMSHGQATLTALRTQWAERDLRTALRADGLKEDVATLRTLNDALAGDTVARDSLPERTRARITEMRAVVDGLSSALVDAGAVPSTMNPVLDGNLGTYLHRSYRLFDDKGWARGVPVHLKNRVAAVFMEEIPGLTKEQADGFVANLLHREDGPMAALSKLGRRERSILMKRSEIHPAVRALWGEYETPFVNYAKSVEKMSRLIEAHKLQLEIERVGKGVFLFDTPGDKARHHVQVGGAERGAFEELARVRRAASDIDPNAPDTRPMPNAEHNRALGPLSKYYTTPEIAALLRNLDNAAAETGDIVKWFHAASGFSQYSKTVLSLRTHIRNMTGNVSIMAANGNWNPAHAEASFKAMAAMSAWSPEQLRARTARYAELGLIGESVSAGTLRETLHLAHVGERSAGGKFLDGVNKVYGMEDDFFKVFAFESELAKLRKAFPARAASDLAAMEREAANVVKDTVPTFSRAPKAIQALRRLPFMGNFVGFPAELTRTALGTIQRGAWELRTEGYREIGAKRLASFVAVAGVSPLAAEEASRRLLGWTKEKAEAAREVLPEFQRNLPVVWLGEKDGKVRAMSLDGLNPYSYFHKSLISMLRPHLEDSPEDGAGARVVDGVAQFIQPYTDEKVLWGRIIDTQRNRDGLTGGEIYNPTDDKWTQWRKQAVHIAGAFTPGTVDSAVRITKAARGTVEDSGRSYNLADEVNATWTGQRVSEIDIAKAVSSRFREFNTREAQANGPLRDAQKAIANGGTNGTAHRLVDAWQETQDRRWREYAAMHSTARAALVLQAGDVASVEDAMRSAKMGKKESDSVLDGAFRASYPDESNRDFQNKFALLPDWSEASSEILRRAAVLDGAPLDKPMPEVKSKP